MAKDITVTLTLDTKNFDKGITKAKGSMAGFGKSSKVTTGSIIGLAARLAPLAAGVVAVGQSFSQLNKALDVSAQFESVGVTLSNIVGSAEGGAAALNKIRDVAKELPVSFEELAGSAPALATVSANIGELEDNIRLAADIAGNFGIPFEVAAGQLQRAFSAGSGAADVFREKGVLAAAGFEAGVTMSIDETIAKLREFGGEIEGSAQSLNETFAGAANQAGDAVTDFQAAIGDAFRPEATVFLQQLTKLFRDNEKEVLAFATAIGQNALRGIIAFARGIATSIDLVLSVGKAAKEIGQAIRQNFGEQIKAVADGVVRAFGLIVESISLVGIGLGKLISLLPGNTSQVENFFTSVNDAANKLRTEGLDAIDDTSEALSTFIPVTTARDAVNELVADFTEGAEEIREEARLTSEAAQQLGDDLKINLGTGALDASAALRALTVDANDLTNSLLGLLGRPAGIDFSAITDPERKKIIEEAIRDGERAKIAQGAIQSAFKNSIITTEEYNAVIRALTGTTFKDLELTATEVADIIRFLNEQFEDQEGIRNFIESLETATKTLSTDLATALLEGQDAAESFKNFFRTIINQIIADILRLAIIQPILGALLAPFGFGFGTGGSIIKLEGKAMGGPVMANRPYIVGERGPELFVPGTLGAVVPNDQLPSGAPTSVVYNINATDARSFQQLVASDPEFIYSVTEAGRRRIPGARV